MAEPGEKSPVSAALEVVARIGSPVALATTLLFYFGWVRSHRQARALGADVSVFDMSSQDYVLRSVNVLFGPIVALVVLSLVGLSLHRRLVGRLDPAATWHRRGLRLLTWSWLAVPVVGGVLTAAVAPGAVGLLLPPLLTAGILAAVYGETLGNRLADRKPAKADARRILVVVLLAILSFLDTERFARFVGEAQAEAIKADLGQLSSVTIFSAKDLRIDAPGVATTRIAAPDSAYLFRYDGLRLLQRSGGTYFLLPPGASRLIVVPDDTTLRFEFAK